MNLNIFWSKCQAIVSNRTLISLFSRKFYHYQYNDRISEIIHLIIFLWTETTVSWLSFQKKKPQIMTGKLNNYESMAFTLDLFIDSSYNLLLLIYILSHGFFSLSPFVSATFVHSHFHWRNILKNNILKNKK